MSKAIFLDRDGTINVEKNYLSNSGDLKLYPNTLKALQNFRRLGFLNIVITNQSGIARGYFTETDLNKIHIELNKLLTDKSHGIQLIDDIYYSPFHPEGIIEEYKKESEDRKPGTGLIRKAITKYDINPEESFFIGDSFADMKCAENAGIKKILVKTGYGQRDFEICRESGVKLEYEAENLYEASKILQNLLIAKNTSENI